MNQAVTAARQAFDSGPWGKTTGAERSKFLLAIADLVEKVGGTALSHPVGQEESDLPFVGISLL